MLTERKKSFADAVLRGLTQKDAAIAAGLSAGSAKQAGNRLAKDPDVVGYLKSQRRTRGRALTLPDGSKAPGAAGWPFGTQAPERPPVAAAAPDPDEDDGLTDEQRAGLSPLDYLLAVMRSSKASKSARMTAAIQAAPYVHAKVAPAGKKEGKNEAAKKVASRFAPAAPPKLAAAGGKRV